MPDISLSHVSFSYHQDCPVLQDISLEIPQGQFLCILGANGSGKSSLVRHINGLLKPTSGTVHVGECTTSNDTDLQEIRSTVGMVFQNPDDQLVASIIENEVAFGPENLGLSSQEIQERVSEALAEVGLIGFDKKETNALSGGQKQRLALAGALAMRPQVLILDEASSMLDPRGRESLMEVCHKLNKRGITLIMVTHFMDEAAQADRIVVLDHGRVQLNGSPLEVLSQTKTIERLKLQSPFALELSQLVRQKLPDFPLCLKLQDFAREIVGCVPDEFANYTLAERLERSPETQISQGTAPAEPADHAPAGHSEHSSETRASTDTRLATPEPNTETHSSQEASPAMPTYASQNTNPAISAPGGTLSSSSNPQDLTRFTAAKELLRFEDVSYAYDKRFAKMADKRRRHGEGTLPNWGNNPNAGWALEGVSFSVYEHEFLGIAGHTGSGKSTLLQHMNGLLRPSRGRVLFQGQDISKAQHQKEALRGVGLVFQYPEHQLFAPSVYDDVAFGPRNLGLTESEVQARVEEALARVHLDFERFKETNPFELSGGQQRRVAFAGILAMQPQVLVLDEPTCGLDPHAKQVFLDLIHQLHEQGLSIVMVSHNMDDLATHTERMLVMDKGKLLCEGAPDQVFLQQERLYAHGLSLPQSQYLTHLINQAADAHELTQPFKPETQFYTARELRDYAKHLVHSGAHNAPTNNGGEHAAQ